MTLVIHTDRQPPSMQRLEGLCVTKLETAATESLSAFFQDPTKPGNAHKVPILKELFRVARAEEKFKRNEIGGLIPCAPVAALRRLSWDPPC